jgi:hypothetical protein
MQGGAERRASLPPLLFPPPRCSCGGGLHRHANPPPGSALAMTVYRQKGGAWRGEGTPQGPGALACEPEDDSFWTQSVGEAFGKVLCGKGVHAERLNAWTHVVGGMIALVALGLLYLPGFRQDGGVRVALSRVATGMVVVAFGVSTLYHTLRTVRPSSVPYVAAGIYAADQVTIFVSMGTSGVADVAAWCGGLAASAWQTWADSLIAAVYIIAFLVVRHVIFDRTPWEYTNCSLGLTRFFVHDGLHSATLASLSTCFVFSQFLPTPALFGTASAGIGALAISMNATSVLLLVGGQLIDGSGGTMLQDMAAKPDNRRIRAFVELPKRYGMIVSGHALWHVLAVVASLLAVFSREIVLANT